MRSIVIAILIANGCGSAMAQTQSRIFEAPVINAGALPPPAPTHAPKGAILVLGQGGWINTIDGKRSGITFSLGSEHVIRGKGFSNTVGVWLTSSRIPRGEQSRFDSVGSVLSVVRQSDTELVVRVTQIAGGKLPWSSTNRRQNVPRLLIRADGGARVFNTTIRDSRYSCAAGEPNCE